MVDIKELTPGTVALGRDGRIAIVTEIRPSNTMYPIIYTYKVDANGYKGNGNDFTAILGKVDLSKFTANKPEPKPVVTGWDDHWLVPAQLKGIKIGDKIKIRSGRGLEVVTYQGYNPNRPKYPVSFTDSKGRSMKGSLNIVVGAISA